MISRYHRSELDVCLLFKALPLCLFVLLGLLKMFDIPIGARHIVIEENETSPHIIGECLLLSHRVFVFFTPTEKRRITTDAGLQNVFVDLSQKHSDQFFVFFFKMSHFSCLWSVCLCFCCCRGCLPCCKTCCATALTGTDQSRRSPCLLLYSLKGQFSQNTEK